MLAALLVRPGLAATSAELVDWVWGADDDLPKNPKGALHLYSSRLRQVLENLPDQVELIVANGTYRLDVDRKTIDYFQFKARLERARDLARRGDHQQALDSVRNAFAVWRHQRPLDDLRSDLAEAWRRRAVVNVQVPALDLLCGEYLVLGECDAVLAELDDFAFDLFAHPALLKRRLEALHRLSRTGEATELFLQAHKAFRSDFDDVCARDLREFHERLSEHGVAPVQPPAAPVGVLMPRQLPPDVRSFVGHDAAFAALDEVAVRPCVALIDGTGGVGKTAFVVHWAHTRTERFPGGVLFADMQGFSNGSIVDAGIVVDGFLQALGVPPDRIANLEHRAARLQSLLSGRDVLAVLDNVRNTNHVQSLLPLLSSCVVLVTSRSHLSGLAARLAVHRVPIRPLESNDARRLLLESIGDGRRDRRELTELANVCDGLPLVLKVLANHIAARPAVLLSAFLRQFEDRSLLDLGALGDAGPYGPKAVFTQSLRALNPEVGFVFRMIGLHPGPDVTVSVAAALTALPLRRVEAALDALVEANLLQQSGALDRFRFHDLLREFAVALNEDPAERAAVERRMVDFYLRTAENADVRVFSTLVRVPTPDGAEKVGALRFSDEESAQRWCVSERHNVLAVVRFAAEAGYGKHAAQIPQLVGQTLVRRGRLDDALTLLHAGLAAQDEDEIPVLQHSIGFTYLQRQQYGLAEHFVHAAHIGFARRGYEKGIAGCLHTGARILVETGNLALGIDSHERALAAVRRIDEPGLETAFLFRAGEAYQRSMDYARAASYYGQALALAREQQDADAEAKVLYLFGSLSFVRERTAEARDYVTAALAKQAQLYSIGDAGRSCVLLAEIELDAKRFREAKWTARTALRLCVRTGDLLGEATALHVLGRVLRLRPPLDGAIEAFERARAIFVDLLNRERAARISVELEELQVDPGMPGTRCGSPVIERDWRIL
ncbi:hypothetical protein FKR81_02080 [Lentzea tibetensis]|uniref:Bacterial transcriptional activator domain-containing protein n=2 Tax=Lentzea tibetensis TaxID=2591470 RepID=A0A563F3L5_9PSEU|nr:hypothetical protein FKR81_02080 [Lentzea tibetensis]